jgi:hypothetical protein
VSFALSPEDAVARPLTLLLVVCAAALTRAEAPPPAERTVRITTAVDALEDFPDYAFFEVWEPGADAPRGRTQAVTLHFIPAGTAAYSQPVATGSSTLYGIPRAAAERVPDWRAFAEAAARSRPPKHESLTTSEEEWVTLARKVKAGEVPGAISVSFATSERRPSADGQTILLHHRLTRTPGGVAFVKVEHPAAESAGERGECGNCSERGNCGNGGPEPAVSWVWAAGGVAATTGALIIFVGVAWLARHLGRRA